MIELLLGELFPRETLALPNPKNLKANFFLERREIGIINIGGAGFIEADEQTYHLNKSDVLYLGKGIEEVTMMSQNPAKPAQFFFISCPAHQSYPSKLMTQAEATTVNLGEDENANRRTIYHTFILRVLKAVNWLWGFTQLYHGNVWNTMPPHTHDRRMEIYFYFDIPKAQKILHLMGQPQETRHLFMENLEAIISPPWSIHAGVGTSAYAFVWAMAGENQLFTDMDFVALEDLK